MRFVIGDKMISDIVFGVTIGCLSFVVALVITGLLLRGAWEIDKLLERRMPWGNSG